MKKYIVKYKGSDKVVGEYNSREEASEKLMNYINNLNDGLEYSYITLFDFVLEEVECKDVNEEITDFESAKKYLVGKTNDDFIVDKKRLSKSIDRIKDAEILIKELNPKHIEALVALNRLFTIAEAWNKADGFAPDFFDMEQDKWYPTFEYYKEKGLVFYRTVQKVFGTKLCFKTSERAEQFGKKFVELYNKVFL